MKLRSRFEALRKGGCVSVRVRVIAVLPTLLLAMAQADRAAAAPPAARRQATSSPSRDTDAVPGGWLKQVQGEVQKHEYDLSWQAAPVVNGIEASWHAPNRAQGFRTYFTAEGIRVVPRTESEPSWRWGLALVGYGRGGTSWAVPSASRAPSGHRIEYRRGAFEERYENTAAGLEQSFTLPAPPGEVSVGGAPAKPNGWTSPLMRRAAVSHDAQTRPDPPASGDEGITPRDLVHVDLALWGDLLPRVAEDGQSIDFVTPSGAPGLHYAQLKVTDARGETLPSWMEGFAGEGVRGIRLVVDARDAIYPITIDPLATSAAWTTKGDQANAQFGFSVATAGDVNGDGYSDVIVGADAYDNGQTDEGRAYLYLGSASGLAVPPAWTAESDLADARFGYSVASAGDVNGDGYSDVVVGAIFFSNGQLGEGRAFVYLGSASGLATTPAWTAESDNAGGQFGGSAAGAGDLNGDGYGDVIVGAPAYTNGETEEGAAFLYLGSASGLAAAPAWTAEGDEFFAVFGVSVATAGDVNGDGYSDAIVGADAYAGTLDSAGRALLYLGSASGLAATPAWTAVTAQPSAAFGHSVATAGDVNGDGYSDVIVGAPNYDNEHSAEGKAFLYLGSASGLGSTAAWTAESNQNFAGYASSVAPAGDVNGDGYADVIVGSFFYDNGQTDEGRAFVYFGTASGLAPTPAWTTEGNQNDAQYGASVATAGDVNGDGYSDVIVGASALDNGPTEVGGAFLYLGSSAGLHIQPAWAVASDQSNSEFGFSAAPAGDVNGDGYSDVIVGAKYYDNDQLDQGRAFVYPGSASGLATTPLWSAEGDQESAFFGNSVATAGDVNGDGYSDVIVGALGYDNGEWDEGRAFVYLGSASGLAATPAWTAESNQDFAEFGVSVATAGDVNGDGYSDVVVGSDLYSNGETEEGRAFVYLGSGSGLATTPAWSAESSQDSSRFGVSVATAGDVNRDGYSDVIVGASHYTNGQASEGRAFVYLGSGSGLAISPGWTAESDQASAHLGASVSTAGDVNGDGYSDVIVGVPDYDRSGPDVGRAVVYLGSASGLASTPAWTRDGVDFALYFHFGTSVATAGDLNGDGYSEVVVTSPGQLSPGRILVFAGSASGLALIPTQLVYCAQRASAATAGDVNGDGVSDLIVGCGILADARLYYGNGGDALDRIPRQARTNGTTPLALLDKSDSEAAFRLRARGLSPAGRGRVRLQWQVAPLAVALNGSPLHTSTAQDSGAPGPSGSAADLNEAVTGLAEGTVYHWRSRIVSDDPFFPRSPWMWLAGSNVTEAKVRTAGCVDSDGDGYGDFGDPSCASLIADCNGADPNVWGTPGETLNLTFASPTSLTWGVPADPGALASSLVYDTLRSGAPGGFLGATCVESDDGPNTTAVDVAEPASRQLFFYLSRAQSSCPSGSGSLGSDSAGTPRTGAACP